jgi:hypothetical protein
MPVKAGIQGIDKKWIPAFAVMTMSELIRASLDKCIRPRF